MKRRLAIVFACLVAAWGVAETVTSVAQFQISNGISRSKTLQETTTGNSFDYRKVTIPTTEYTNTFDTEVGNAEWCFIVNADTGNYVRVGFSAGSYDIRLRPSQTALLPLEPATASLFLIADTASCEVEIFVHEE